VGKMLYDRSDICRYFDGPLRGHPPTSTAARERAGLVAAKLLVFAFVMTVLSAYSASKFDRETLAAHGMIDEHAPVKATVQIAIQAPPKKIWGLLTNIKDWAAWQPDISNVEIQASARLAVPFSWSTGGMTIHSTI
jgi:uncharacterized membrane protein